MTIEQTIQRLRDEGTSWERIAFAVPLAKWAALLDVAGAACAEHGGPAPVNGCKMCAALARLGELPGE